MSTDNLNEDFLRDLFSNLYGSQQAYTRAADPERELCQRMCAEMQEDGIRLKWHHASGTQVHVALRLPSGEVRFGPAATTKRGALVALAQNTMR